MDSATRIIMNYSDTHIQAEFAEERGVMFNQQIQSSVYTNDYADVVFKDGSVLRLTQTGWKVVK